MHIQLQKSLGRQFVYLNLQWTLLSFIYDSQHAFVK